MTCCQVSDRCPLGYLFGMLQGSRVERTVPETFAMPSQHIIRVHTGQGKVKEISFFFKVREKSGNFGIRNS